jgi:hypothetical protein
MTGWFKKRILDNKAVIERSRDNCRGASTALSHRSLSGAEMTGNRILDTWFYDQSRGTVPLWRLFRFNQW